MCPTTVRPKTFLLFVNHTTAFDLRSGQFLKLYAGLGGFNDYVESPVYPELLLSQRRLNENLSAFQQILHWSIIITYFVTTIMHSLVTNNAISEYFFPRHYF